MEITVRCPSGREHDVSVRCQSDWRVTELKQHLSRVYPGRPAADTQRIVFAGRLLGNDEALAQAIGEAAATQVVHLVLPSAPAATRSASAPGAMADAAVDSPTSSTTSPSPASTSDELANLWREYTQYVHLHYINCLATGGVISGAASSNAAPASAAAAAAAAAAAPRPPIAPDADADADAADVAAGGAGIEAGGGGGLRAWARTAMRCALMSLIILYYSSAGKALSAFAIFFVMQAVQGGLLHWLVRFGRPAAPAAAAAPAEALAAAGAEEEAPHHQQQQHQQQQQQEEEEPQRAATLTETLAAFLDSLLTTLVAFFTSLIPERPPPLAQ